uniref:7TM GPCR serpentine receptor class x (Srx) domain-containing protein n=1 Tax=Panagrellus redivivus TaxID=6233 RepID=A0A7E4V9I7_PANRE
MHDFRHCITMLCVLDGLFAFLLGIVINVTFQFPALAGVLKGPCIMFFYRLFGYNGCKVIVCLTFQLIAAILYIQNYGIKFRFFTIYPNKKYFEYYSSTRGLIYVYSSCVVLSSVIGISIYILMHSENEIPTVVANYPNTKEVFMDYIPGQNVLMAANPQSAMWFFIFGYVTICVLICEITSYGMFFLAMRMLKKFSSNFTKQTLQMQKQFLRLLIVQATTPLAFLVIPVLLLVYQVTFEMPQARLQTEIGMLWIGLYSNVNACLTIFCISPVRKFTKRITVDPFLKVFGVNVKVTPLEIQATSSLNFNSRIF